MPHLPPACEPSSAPAEFFRGMGDVWRGFSYLMRHPRLLPWALIPFVLNILFFVLLSWGIWHFLGGWVDRHLLTGQGFWLSLLGWLVRALAWIVIGLVVVFTFVPLATLIAAPFNDVLSEKVEKLCAGAGVDQSFSLRALARVLASGLHSSLRLTLLTLILILCALPLHLLPGIGSALATAASVAITIRFLSLQFTAYSMDRRLYSYRQRRDFLRRHRARTIGLGTMAFLVMLVPGAGALFIPVSAVAGTLLFCDTQPLGERPH